MGYEKTLPNIRLCRFTGRGRVVSPIGTFGQRRISYVSKRLPSLESLQSKGLYSAR